MKKPTLDDMRDDLDRAYEKSAVAFYHIGKVVKSNTFISEMFYEEDFFDVYVALKSNFILKEDELKRYMRKRYGHLIRVLAVELYG